MEDQPERVVCYRIDRDDVIVEVGGDWHAFAGENGGHGLEPAGVIRKRLWRFIYGDETTRLYEALCRQVRTSGQSACFPFRCDSPASQRFMQMTIAPGEGGSLLFTSRQLREEVSYHKISCVCHPRMAPDLILRCSMCNRLRVGGNWCDPNQAVSEAALFVRSTPLQIAYSICSECDCRIKGMLFTRQVTEPA